MIKVIISVFKSHIYKICEMCLCDIITHNAFHSCHLPFAHPCSLYQLQSHVLPYSTVFQVRVVIVDENDCIPEFLQSIYSKDGVPETVTTATSLLQGETSVHFIAPQFSQCLVLHLISIFIVAIHSGL